MAHGPNEFTSTVRTDGYFAQGTVDLWNQLYLTGAARLDGSNTFGGENKRYVYPKASVAWDLSERVQNSPLTPCSTVSPVSGSTILIST